MKITFAEKCAWRAMYVTAFGKQIFRIGIDPTTEYGPKFFIASGLFGHRGYRGLRITLPHIKWGWASQYGPRKWHSYLLPTFIRTVLYRASSKFWHSFDGRNAYYREQQKAQ
jgi:hypothetical protein